MVRLIEFGDPPLRTIHRTFSRDVFSLYTFNFKITLILFYNSCSINLYFRKFRDSHKKTLSWTFILFRHNQQSNSKMFEFCPHFQFKEQRQEDISLFVKRHNIKRMRIYQKFSDNCLTSATILYGLFLLFLSQYDYSSLSVSPHTLQFLS